MSYQTVQDMDKSMLLYSDEDKKKEKEQEMKNGIRCPICTRSAVRICNCDQRDSMCSKGHKWYMKNNKVVVGQATH